MTQLDQDSHEKTSSAVQKRRREKERLSQAIDRLNNELLFQQESHEKTMKRLESESKIWFENCSNRYEIVSLMLQYCIRPRSLFSPSDAVFTAKFVLLMHSLGTINFSSLTLLDRVYLFCRKYSLFTLFRSLMI